MIPISDESGPTRKFPFVNIALILVNVAVFVAEQVYGDCFVAAYSVVPTAITQGHSLPIQGCPYGEPAPVYITLITAMFLHANVLHIGGNMLFLFVFGDNVEDRLGHIPYLIFYLACGIVAGLAQIAMGPNSTELNLGASGAIAGVLAAYLVFFPAAKVRTIIFLGFFITLVRLSAFIVIGAWFVLQLVDAFLVSSPSDTQSGGVAYFAHIGGFLFGLIVAVILLPFARQRGGYDKSYPYWPRHRELDNTYSR